jgi:hypothetical protein
VGLITARLVWWGSTSDAGHQEGGDDEALWNRWQCSGSGVGEGCRRVDDGQWLFVGAEGNDQRLVVPVLNRRFPIKFEFLGS